MNGKASLHETSKSCRLPGTAKPPGHFDACNVTAAGGSSRSVLVGGAFFRGARTLRLEVLPVLASRALLRGRQRSALREDPAQLVPLHHLVLQQPGGHLAERFAVPADDLPRAPDRFLEKAGDFLVDAALRALAVRFVGQAGHPLRPGP